MSKIPLYDETAEVYHRRYYQIQRVKYQALVPYLNEGLILDVGIGIPSLIGYGAVVGVDLSIEMLEIAKQQTKDYSQWDKIVSLVCASAESLPFRSHVFPIIVSVTLIQNLTNPKQGVQEFYRVLQLSGLLGMTVLAKQISIQQLESLIPGRNLILTRLNNLANEDVGLILQVKPEE